MAANRESSAPWVFVCLCMTVTFVVVAPNASSQISTASINGVVRDATGAIVPGVSIVLKNVDTEVTKSTVSNEAGIYVIRDILPGPYVLEASKEGFSKQVLAQFTLVVNQKATFDFTMAVGERTDSVTVEAVGAGLQASSADLGALISRREVQDLPLNGRNFTALLILAPGASPVNVSQNQFGQFPSFGGLQTSGSTVYYPAMNGQPNRANYFWMDGINNANVFGNGYAVPPILDAIQEFKSQSHVDSVQFGGNVGASVNVVTKSGTNDFHGALWEFLRNDILNARGAFALGQKTPLRYNMFGATAGGPVMLPHFDGRKNQTYFFAGWQEFRYTSPRIRRFIVPTADNLRGDLSLIGGLPAPFKLYDPYTTRPDPNNPGKFIRDPYPNNIIPANQINPGMVTYLKAFEPAPTDTGLPGFNGIDTTPYVQSSRELSFRGDHTFSAKDSVWFRYSQARVENTESGGVPAAGITNHTPYKNWGASWVHTFGPKFVLQAQLGRNQGSTQTYLTNFNIPDIAAFGKSIGWSEDTYTMRSGRLVLPALGGGWPGVSSQGFVDTVKLTDIWQYRATMSRFFGKHFLEWGGDMHTSGFEQHTDTPTIGFGTQTTWDPLTATGGSGMAGQLLGLPDTTWGRSTIAYEQFAGLLGLFVQDQWKVTPKLTVNFGLRWDRKWKPEFGNPDLNGQTGGADSSGMFDFNDGTYHLAYLPQPCSATKTTVCIPGGVLPEHVVVNANHKLFFPENKNFQPRVSFAYRLTNKTVIRAGGGFFFEQWADIAQGTQNFGGNWPDTALKALANLNYPTAVGGPGPTWFVTPSPYGSVTPAASPFAPGAAQGAHDPHIRSPKSQQWNLGIQHELAPNNVLTLNYVGSSNIRMWVGGYYNTATTPGFGPVAPRAPYPYAPATYFNRSRGHSSYNAFQATFSRSFHKGLAATVNYTWSKSIDYGNSGFENFEGFFVQDTYNLDRDKSVSAFDLPHMLTASWLWDLPFGKAKSLSTGNKVADYIIGNWQVNGILTLQSGTPYNITVSGDSANVGGVSHMHANVVGDWHRPEGADPRMQWFNPLAFVVPPIYTFGNMGRHVLRNDWNRNWDLSLFRDFPFSESKRLQFRAEFYNAFNQTVLSTPTATVGNVFFGRITSQRNSPRQIQLSLKFYF
jgi:hypothetical protein